MAKNSLQKLLEASAQMGELTPQQAEGTVKKLVKAGAIRRSETEAAVQAMIDRGRAFAEAVQHEVTKQVGWLASRVDDLEDQIESLVSRLNPAGGATAVKQAPAKKAPAKRAPARKRAPAKQAVGSSGVRKVATTRPT